MCWLKPWECRNSWIFFKMTCDFSSIFTKFHSHCIFWKNKLLLLFDHNSFWHTKLHYWWWWSLMKCLLALSVTVSQQEKMASFMIPNEDDEVCKKMANNLQGDESNESTAAKRIKNHFSWIFRWFSFFRYGNKCRRKKERQRLPPLTTLAFILLAALHPLLPFSIEINRTSIWLSKSCGRKILYKNTEM